MSIRHFLDVSCPLYMLKVGFPRRKYVEKIGVDGYEEPCVCAGRCREEQLQRAPHVFVHFWAS